MPVLGHGNQVGVQEKHAMPASVNVAVFGHEFDFQGAALPSIGLFQNPAQVCASYNPWNVPCVIGG